MYVKGQLSKATNVSHPPRHNILQFKPHFQKTHAGCGDKAKNALYLGNKTYASQKSFIDAGVEQQQQ